jgi:hypothetical protein
MEAVTNRAEGEKPGLSVTFAVVRDHHGFFLHEGLDNSETNPMFGEVGFALRLIAGTSPGHGHSSLREHPVPGKSAGKN